MPTQEMRVDNTAFLIEKLASDCAPLQYVRELTSNALQAIEARRTAGWEGEGVVIWDVDWQLVEAQGVYKLQISDNGTGMTGPEIQQYINHLSSSGRVQDRARNFGLGAKITASVRNPAGLVYKSWRDGEGTIAIVWKDPETGYGLRQLELGPGRYGHVAAFSDAAKSEPIDDCGTSVVLLGENELNSDTFMPSGATNKWLIKYLNDRYFAFPPGITVKARNFQRTERAGWPSRPDLTMGMTDGEEAGSQLKTIPGMRANLEKVAVARGTVALKNATAHWWLLPEEEVKQRDIWECSGHCAALFQGELYDFLRGLAGRARLREFGIVFGTSRVVLYVEPNPHALEVYSNTARSALLSDGGPLPWSDWAKEFREAIPAEIQGMMDALVSKSGDKDHREAIKRRLKEIRDLLRPSRYRRMPGGALTVGGEIEGGEPGSGSPRGTGGGTSGTRGGSKGGLYGSFIKAGGDEADPIAAREDIPDIKWISVADGTREHGDLEDRAARFNRTSNLLQINADFRVFHDLIKRCSADYNPSGDANVETEVRDVVREWIGLQLTEAIVSVTAMEGSLEWGSDIVDKSLSEEALTTAALPRYVMLKTINRALGARFSKKATPEDA
jgi:hypothetical protein